MAKSTPPLPSDERRLKWLQLARSENVGPVTFRRFLKRYGTPENALEALPHLASQGGLKRPLKIAPLKAVEEELYATRALDAEIITLEDPHYPSLLRHIESAPPVLTIKGNLDLLQSPLFAIVGARNASAMGKKMSSQLASELGTQGWVISSGLARGIDAAAHQGALQTGTVAVLAGGIDKIYPPENEALQTRIGVHGVLIAESPLGTEPQATLFPRRNRIISGISKAVLVVEAALKSGSLITARCALEQGRDVFAIPGSPLDPRCRGANQLIKNGAILVETIEDICHEISCQKPLHLEENPEILHDPIPSASLNNIRHLINENLSYVPISIDELIRECQLSASDVWGALLEMEIAGRLNRQPGGKVALKEK